jgi:MFS transporter, Spinster family, sphingosine-1-phosphate transporter
VPEPVGPPADRAAAPARRTAYWALAVLAAINLLNYLDRYVIAPLTTDLKREMSLSDTQLGWLLPAFILVYLVAAPVFGAWGDRGSRTKPIALGIGIWSIATMLSGLTHGYPHLLAARALVGIGEASVVAIAPALLADLFAPAGRARVYAVLNGAIPVGAALGYVVGGQVGAHFGWRAAFFVAGAPGIVLAIASLWLPDPPRGIQDGSPPAATGERPGALALYRSLLGRARYMVMVLGYAAYTFALGGLAYWMPTFLERVRGVPQASAATDFGLVVLGTGIVGTMAGGWLADYFLKYSKHSYMWFSGIVTVLAAPVALIALAAADRTLYFPAIVVAELLLFMSTGPVNAAIVNIVSPFERASAAALTMVVIHLLGDVPSPVLIGYLSDHISAHSGDAASLARAVLVVPIAIFIAGLIWLLAARGSAREAPAPA